MWLIGVFFGIAGLIIGSFLNVCIYRIPLKKSIVYPHSACAECGHKLGLLDLFPVISYIFLRGRCRYCGKKISAVYPLVELLTAAMFILLYIKFGLSWPLIVFLAVVSLLVITSFIDIRHKEIPDGLVIALLVIGAIYTVYDFKNWLEHIIGFFAGGLPLLLIAFFSEYALKKEGMGGGDIKLMAALGLIIGWKLIMLSLTAGIIIGAIAGLILIAAMRADKKANIPFGPFLAIGFFISVMAGNEIINWYISFFR